MEDVVGNMENKIVNVFQSALQTDSNTIILLSQVKEKHTSSHQWGGGSTGCNILFAKENH